MRTGNDVCNLGVIQMTLWVNTRNPACLEKAEALFKEAIEIDTKANNLQGVAIDTGNLGMVYSNRCDQCARNTSAWQSFSAQAENLVRKALTINEQIGFAEGIANQNSNLGVIYEDRGEFAKARQYWIEARNIYQRIGMSNLVNQMNAWIAGLPKTL